MKISFKKAFTLTEIIVATLISTIILWLIFVFLWDVLENIAQSKSDSKIITWLYDLNVKLDNYRDIYSTGWILIDNSVWVWNDVFLMENVNWTSWVLFWAVDADSKKIIKDSSIYSNKIFWFRIVSASEIASIKSNPNLVYDLNFRNENLFYNLVVKDLQLNSFNWGLIYNINLVLVNYYKSELDGEKWDILNKDDLREFYINF